MSEAMAGLLGTVAVVGSGIVAGVLFAVALSLVPAMSAMPPDRYVYTHQLLGRNWDPTMPIIVLGSAVIDGVLGLAAGRDRAVYLAAGLLLIAVSVVSHFCNVPINRRVKSLDASRIPDDWRDPRPLWRRWHLLRTALAVAALVVNAIAAVAM